MIDWSKLETYQRDKYRSFEELCYQIAKEHHGEMGRFTSIDDSGGGDGVEFYLTLPNGEQWGWQAKFYYPNRRLTIGNRKQSITESLKKACEIHPHLKKWILCTPTNFTTKEQTWFENALRQSIPEGRSVELEHWGDSDFNNWLSNPRFAGKRNYFFGELELDINWFQAQFDKQKTSLGEKFSSSLHTESQVDAHLHALLGDHGFMDQITELIEKLQVELSNLNEAIDNLERRIPNGIAWDVENKSKVIGAVESLQHALVNVMSTLEKARENLNEKRLSETQEINWESVLSQLKCALDTYRTVKAEYGISKIRYTGNSDGERVIRDMTWMLDDPDSLVADLLDDFLQEAIERCQRINHAELNILGDAGIGKTHIACNICDDRLKSGLPALFVRGSLFTTNQPIEAQLRTILDIPPSYSWHDFLQALSAIAEVYHTRIPLIFDGLNESTHNGAFSNVWKLGLKGFLHEIEQTKNVVLITTCRTRYKEAIWAENNPPNRVRARGFDTDEVKHEAISKYFNAYKIKADLTMAPLSQFKHPLYLKIFCVTKNPTRETEKHIYVGEETLFEVFQKYLEQCNKAVCARLELRRGTPVVGRALNKMAEHMWQHRRRHVPLKELVGIVDQRSIEELHWLSSKTHAIEDEGLLVCRDWGQDEEVMYFTYDLLGGYTIAQYLLQQASDDVEGFLNGEETVASLFGEAYGTLHPMYGDIRRCMAALLPAATGKLLHEFSDNKTAFSLSIEVLFEISPRHIREDCINLVIHLFDDYQKNRSSLLKFAETTIGNIDHPFNASFWSDRLFALPMPERDLSWTEHIRQNVEGVEKLLMRFEEPCQSDQDLSDVTKERLHLFAEYVMWLLTSTARPLRDKATRALFWYGRRFPQDFFDLVMKSLSINDPYVPERMLATTYGIAMSRQHDFKDANFPTEILPEYGRKLYETMFKPNAAYSTTHILARDYARRTIDIALIHHPDLLTVDERKYITSPFTEGGIRKWGEIEDRNADDYRNGNAPLHMDFRNYTLAGLVKDRGNYDFEHDEYKRVLANIFWRIYDLGYSLDSFKEIDALVFQENQRYGRLANGRKTDRYGKKYSWIAFYELAGFRQDKNLLSEYCDDARILDADIDPSFPAELTEYDFVKEDFLGDREMCDTEWISEGDSPDLTPYLRVDRLFGAQSTWILLEGSLSQKNDCPRRHMSAVLRGLIVKTEESEEIVERLRGKKIDLMSIPSCPKDHLTYAGEIPWCNTYPRNEWTEMSIEIGPVLAPIEQQTLLHNDEPKSERENDEIFAGIGDLIEANGEEVRLVEQDRKSRVESVELERKEYKDFQVLSPVRIVTNNWDDYHSTFIASPTIATPSKQMAETFSLCGQPQSFDFFERDGKRASIAFGHGKEWQEMQRFTYLRKDLLERYLEEINAELIWVIWGERCLLSQDKNAPHQHFQDIRAYSQM